MFDGGLDGEIINLMHDHGEGGTGSPAETSTVFLKQRLVFPTTSQKTVT